jgi:hypothetical protein
MLTIPVEYRLAEYLAVVIEMLPAIKAARKAGKPLHALPQATSSTTSAFEKALVAPLAAAAFLYKRHKLGICIFGIDATGVRRRSKADELFVSWSDVKAVFRLTNAYLVAKEGGAMPIPYRCLSGEQRARLEELLSNAGHGATAA